MSSDLLRPVIILGGGGHASVVVDILRSQNREILAIISPNDIQESVLFDGILHLKSDQDISRFSPNDIMLVNAVGMMAYSKARYDINQGFLALGYEFETIVASNAQVSDYAVIDKGVQIFAGCIIQAGAHVKAHSIINSGVIIEHDCVIGRYNHLAPGVILCGQVSTEEHVFIGAGASVVQNVNIARESVVGAGAQISKDVLPRQTVYPARTFIKEGQI